MVLDAGVDGLGVQCGDRGGHYNDVRVRRLLGGAVISPDLSVLRDCISLGIAYGGNYLWAYSSAEVH